MVVDEIGRGMRPDGVSYRLRKAAVAAALPLIPLHGMRHSSVSAMLRSGVPVHIASAWHGRDTALMLKVYAHALPSQFVDAGAMLAKAYGG